MITLNYSSDDGLTWNTLGTVAMSYYGGYSYTTTSSQLPLLTCQTEQDYYINASFAGNAQYAPSSATILIQVYPIYPDISMQVSAGPFVTNQPFTISGKITDSHTGKACPSIWIGSAAYNLDTDSFQLVGLTQANANGVYRLPAVQLPAGPWRIMLAAPGDFNHILAWNYFDITINTAPTQLSIASGTTNPAAYKPFTVYGLLTNAVTGARLPNEGGLTLTYYNGGGWNTLPGSVSTNANGQYAFSLTLPAGYYLIKVHFPGDLPNYYPSDNQQQPWTIYVS
jgi:protocatechuate 3,4-dioxygenase beta subunit